MLGRMTLLDWVKRQEPGNQGIIAAIVEMLNQSNEMLTDMHWTQGNLETGHRTTIRAGLPPSYWRQINQAGRVVNCETTQVDEPCALMENWSEVDEEIVELGADPLQTRLSEAYPIIESMSQEGQRAILYGGTRANNPEQFPGLANRYNTLSTSIPISNNIISARRSGDSRTAATKTSIWLICWGPKKITGIFPKNTVAGIQRRDYGLVTRDGTLSNQPTVMSVYREQFKWRLGIATEDYRYAVRICNIDVADLNTASGPDLIEHMTKAYYRIPGVATMGGNVNKLGWYMNRTCMQYLDIQRQRKAVGGTGITYEEVDGKQIPHWRGIPIKVVDRIINTEAVVS